MAQHPSIMLVRAVPALLRSGKRPEKRCGLETAPVITEIMSRCEPEPRPSRRKLTVYPVRAVRLVM